MLSLSDSIALKAQGLIGRVDPPGPGLDDPSDIINLIRTIITTAYAIAGVAAVGFIIVAGFSIITAGGEPDKMRKGQSTLANAVIGLVIIVCSSLIFNFIANRLGVEDIVSVLNLPFL